MKGSIRNGWKKSWPVIIAVIGTIICLVNILIPATIFSQTSTQSPSPTTNTALPAILSFSLEFTPASSPPTPSASSSSPAPNYFDIVVRTQILGINLVDKSGEANVTGEGHLVYYSGIEPDVVPTWPAYRNEGYYASTKTSLIWTNALPDYSVYGVQIVNNDNTPLNPPVYAMIRTFKQLSMNPDRPMITSFGFNTSPPSSPMPSPGPLTRMDTNLKTGVSGFDIVNNFNSPTTPGEGHLIYYEVVDPVITTTDETAFVGGDYSFATTATKFTWLNEIPGYISYSVQLVNNDNTPLRYPVFAIIKTYVYSGMQASSSPTLSPTPSTMSIVPSNAPATSTR